MHENTAGFAADTEILARRGWLTFDQLGDTDEVATRSPEGRFDWHKPAERHCRPFDGEMVEFASKSIDLLVTPAHQMLVRRPAYYMQEHPQAAGADWHPRPASYFADHPTSWWEFPSTSRWEDGESPAEFVIERQAADRSHPAYEKAADWLRGYLTAEWTLSADVTAAAKAAGIGRNAFMAARNLIGAPTRKVGGTGGYWETGRPTREPEHSSGGYHPVPGVRMPMRALCSLLGLFLAEGWVRADRDDIIISQYPTSRHMPEIKAILAATGLHWPYDERNNKFTTSSKALADWLRENAGKRAWGKHVPDGFLDLDADLLNALLRGMMIGDGHWGPQGQRYYTTTSPRFADEVQEIFQKVGADAWIRPNDPVPGQKAVRRIYVVRERMQEAHMLPKATLREYHGSVYDVTVPNPTVYVRRNGRAVWA